MTDSKTREHAHSDALPLDPEEAAEGFSALGSEARLDLIRLLVRAGPAGMIVGDLKKATGAAGSTLSHHIRFLSQTGMLTQEKSGRKIICRANFERIESLVAYLTSECCVDAAPDAAPEAAPAAAQTNAPAEAAQAKPSLQPEGQSDERPHRISFRSLVGS